MNVLLNAQPLLESAGGVKTYVVGLLHALRDEQTVESIALCTGGDIIECPDNLAVLDHPEIDPQNSLQRRVLRRTPLRLKMLAKEIQLRAKVARLPSFVYHEPNHLLHRWPQRSVVTIHDLTCLTLPQFHPKQRVALFRAQLLSSIKRADAVITVSETVRQQVVDRFSLAPAKVHAIPPGVSVRNVSIEEQSRILDRLRVERPFFLCVGAVEPRKNIALVARAALQLRQSGTHVQVVHVGPHGWNNRQEEELIARLTEIGVWKRLGVVDQDTLATLYARCLCLIFPSHDEGFGLPPVEAMASGSPVIASDIPVHREVLGDAAAYCDPRSPDSLQCTMLEILHDPGLRQERIERGLERAKLYQWKCAAARTIEVYESISM